METIGDVKYSILEPATFIRLNPGWVLMQGQNIEGSSLNQEVRIRTLPDARGTFIRSMNIGQSQDLGDTDVNRVVGSWQADTFKEHTHEMELRHSNANFGTGPYINPAEGKTPIQDKLQVKVYAAGVGNKETRPRNITLYLYVKID